MSEMLHDYCPDGCAACEAERNLELCKLAVSERGFTPSDASFCDSTRAVSFSVESHGPSTFGHPRCLIEAKLQTFGGWKFYRENSPIDVPSQGGAS